MTGPRRRTAPPTRRDRRGRRADRGSAALEYLGVLPILLLVALAGIQLGLVAYTVSQAGTAARAAARAEAKYDSGITGVAAGQSAVSGWLAATITVGSADGGDAVTATASIPIPSVIPGISIFDPVQRSATMPKEDDSTP